MKNRKFLSTKLVIVGMAIGAALWGYLVVVSYAIGRIPALYEASMQWDGIAAGSLYGTVPLVVCIAASMAFALDDVITPHLQRGLNSLIHAVIRGLLPGLVGGALSIERAYAAGILSFGIVRGVLTLFGFLAASILCFYAFAPRNGVPRADQS